MATVLSRADIHRLLQKKPPLVEDWIDLEQQVQPNGFSVSLYQPIVKFLVIAIVKPLLLEFPLPVPVSIGYK